MLQKYLDGMKFRHGKGSLIGRQAEALRLIEGFRSGMKRRVSHPAGKG